ncbi:MAG: hypothetical protein Q7W30_05665 [Coriobacteriia bacterium]|nr:hypothetical protein [Coriobacteriia bacterium]
MSRRYPTRQAVVVIHGIGEQKPMQTLRSFVNEIVTTTNTFGQKLWNQPDRMSDSFELRKFTAPGDRKDWPRTDYFEYYWAANMRDTKYSHVLTWFVGLLFKRPWDIPARIRLIWWGSWGLAAFAVLAAAMGWIAPPGSGGVAPASWTAAVLAALVAAILNGAFLGFIGDAARYLSPNPDNIAQRQAIRSDGVRLIRQLHACGKYGRIIVVGHSLGSVIAYDILRFIWDEYRESSRIEYPGARDEILDEMRALMSEGPGGDLKAFALRYQDAQERLWRAEREHGGTWLVTDLVTCGSPLAHAAVLLASSPLDLAERQRERELPMCPPRTQDREDAFTYGVPDTEDGDPETAATRIIHNSALFACTRWSNLYFESDFIAGPLAEVFGPGIRDIRVETEDKGAKDRRWNLRYALGKTWASHTMYWQPPKPAWWNRSAPPMTWDSIRRLRGAMQVNDMVRVTFPATKRNDAGTDD